MKPSLVYSNAVLSSREHFALNQNRIKKMIGANSFSDAAKILIECGYDESTIASCHENEDLIISSEHAATVERFKKLCSDKALLACVLAEYDYHNAKVLFTARLNKSSSKKVTYPFGSIDLHKLEKLIAEKQYQFLPTEMETALKALANIPSPTASEINHVFEAALIEAMRPNINKIVSVKARKYYSDFTAGTPHTLEAERPSLNNAFSLDNVWNWFILKQTEFRTVKTILAGKKLGISREKTREMLRGINDK